jgi:hypothetical protein
VVVPRVSADQVDARDHGTSYCRSDSEEGRQAPARLGVNSLARPAAALYGGMALVHPGNAEAAETFGSTYGQPDWPTTTSSSLEQGPVGDVPGQPCRGPAW